MKISKATYTIAYKLFYDISIVVIMAAYAFFGIDILTKGKLSQYFDSGYVLFIAAIIFLIHAFLGKKAGVSFASFTKKGRVIFLSLIFLVSLFASRQLPIAAALISAFFFTAIIFLLLKELGD